MYCDIFKFVYFNCYENWMVGVIMYEMSHLLDSRAKMIRNRRVVNHIQKRCVKIGQWWGCKKIAGRTCLQFQFGMSNDFANFRFKI